jgi:hypothetical protein
MWVEVTTELIMCGESYPELLFHWLIPELDNMGLPNSVIFKEDGSPFHFAAGAYLDN